MVDRQHFSKTQNFEEALQKFSHLREYVQKFSLEGGSPEFRVQLDRSLRSVENPNIIYPVGDPLFTHIYKDKEGEVVAQSIMPELSAEEEDLYEAVLDRIIEVAHTAEVPKTLDELRDVLLSLYNEVTEVSNYKEKDSIFASMKHKIKVTKAQFDMIQFHLIKDRLGYSKLEPLLRDMYIEDVSCVGVGHVFVVHKIFGPIKTSVKFSSDLELNKYMVESSERVERPVSDANPVVDAIMPDGSRVNYIYSRKISLNGSSFTIRKFNESPISVTNLVQWGTWSAEMAAYLWLCCENGISIFVCGETASGKTTTLNAMTAFIPFDNKVYSVEQTPEITIPHPVWQHLVTRESGQKTDVTMFTLLIASLRSRPDYIIVGEIRGQEANITFQAMQTGHPVISTFHAGSVHSMIQRLSGDPINIPIAFMDNLNVVLIQSAVYVNGKMERRVLSITELIRYSDEVGKVLTKEVFTWDTGHDKHMFRGLYNSHILENKIAQHIGLEDPREIYDIMRRRTQIVQAFIDNKLYDYFELVEILKKFGRDGERSLPFSVGYD
ncbi:MAG: type II/IV secretion system ATPase subunit [Nanoarchaeota archaeon]|nr:type II/IV secretion system ATPase subunit [Nanoarchaeota archaeon]